MAATSHPLATLSALELLREGANAVDAVLAAAAVLAVVEPQSTGIGGDCFVLYKASGGPLIALNGSGYAPAGANARALREQGVRAIGLTSAHAVTVPGAVAAWARLAEDYGTKPLPRLLEPAAALAEEGYPVSPRVAFDWQREADKLAAEPAARAAFLPEGRSPEPGETHRQPALGQTLRLIGRDGAQAFYEGAPANEIVALLNARGGRHTLEDFAAFEPEYVRPVSTSYRGIEVFECPPNGQGVAALVMLNILEGFDLARFDPLGPERFHLEAEATRLAFRERDRLIADPAQAEVPVDALISKERAARLRGAIDMTRALERLPPSLVPGYPDTVYLAVVDGEGNAVSFINSLFHGFGSGLFAPGCGVMLHNRGASFSLEPGHPNALAPRKRPLHTIMPALAMKQGKALMPFGVVGGHYQPVGQVHVLCNMLDYGMDPQEAIDCPRGFSFEGLYALEAGVPEATATALRARGHRIARANEPLGGGQAIWIDRARGVLIGGSDSRKDGCALGL